MAIDSTKITTIDMDYLVSQRLKKCRLMLGIILKEIDNIIGVNIRQIQEYEKLHPI